MSSVWRPAAIRNGYISTRSYHSGGVNSAFGDASVRFVTNGAAGWTAAGSRNGGEVPVDN